MRLTILTNGSRGDVQPYVALGIGLMKAGYSVQLAVPETLKAFVEPYGLPFVPAGIDTNIMLRDDQLRGLLAAVGHNPMLRIGKLVELAHKAEEFALRLVTDAARVCKDSDAVLCAANHYYAGEAITEKFGAKLFYLNLLPVTPTRYHPSAVFAPLPRSLAAMGLLGYNWLSHWITLQLVWQASRPMLNRVRKTALGLPKLPVWLRMRRFDAGGPGLYAYSPHVIPRPADWRSMHHVTGYWFLDEPPAWRVPQPLIDFLSAGSPPVYIGFGSMIDGKVEELLEIIMTALARTHQRAILARGWAALAPAELRHDVFVVDDVPHAWLFPRIAAVVHHGGAGTTAAAFRAGLPQVVIPFISDQFFWGRRVFALSVGSRPIARKQLSVDRLASAISTVMNDPALRDRARILGERIRNEDGIQKAVNIIASHGVTA